MAHILVLEDDMVFGSLLKDSLENEGHTISWCLDATSAFAEFRERPPDIVVADLIVLKGNRPIPDGGLSLIARLKHRGVPEYKSVPVIAISGAIKAKGLETALVTAETLGADASLAKPFSPQELLDVVDLFLVDKSESHPTAS